MAFSAPITLTFGIEIEAIFCFHEDLLLSYLHRTSPPSALPILRETAAIERSLRHRAYPMRPYRSWALPALVEDPTTHNTYTKLPFVALGAPSATGTASDPSYRAYRDEPIAIVSELLSRVPGYANLPTQALHGIKAYTYTTWNISNDFSLSGVPGDVMQRLLPDRGVAASPTSWDSWGVELVSPIYTTISAATLETTTLINALRGSQGANHGAVVTEDCGFHVHVGQPNDMPFNLRTLRHLAWLLILFEDAISGMHAEHRRRIYSGENGNICEILSNRDHWVLEVPAGPVSRTVREGETGELVTRLYDQMYADLDVIRKDIFGTAEQEEQEEEEEEGTDLYDQNLRKLIALVNPKQRAHVVNFTGLITHLRPQTVEFRQHTGTLDAEEMGNWIKFCTTLVACAHRNASGRRVPFDGKRWEEVVEVGIEGLWEEMGLENGVREWYRGRGLAAGLDTVFEETLPEDDFEEDEVVEEME